MTELFTTYSAAVESPRTVDIHCTGAGCGQLLGHVSREGKDQPLKITLADSIVWSRILGGSTKQVRAERVRAQSSRLAKIRTFALPLKIKCLCSIEMAVAGGSRV